jgi:hypothetical protein
MLVWIGNKVLNIFSIKNKYDDYIDLKIEEKIEPMKTQIMELKKEQAITREDILDIKIQVTRMSSSLEFIANIFRNYWIPSIKTSPFEHTT